MLHLISKLQQKPERVRKHIALLFASSVTGVIVIFWLVSWAQYEPEEVMASENQGQGPFEALTQGLGSFFSDTGDMIGDATEEFSALKEEVVEAVPSAESGEVSEY